MLTNFVPWYVFKRAHTFFNHKDVDSYIRAR
jgi:hypothetical protein